MKDDREVEGRFDRIVSVGVYEHIGVHHCGEFFAKDALVDHETPLIALDEAGTTVTGFIDLLIETEKGFWIIDHKSDRTEDLDAAFTFYLPQLLTYADAVANARSDIGNCMTIFWIKARHAVRTVWHASPNWRHPLCGP